MITKLCDNSVVITLELCPEDYVETMANITMLLELQCDDMVLLDKFYFSNILLQMLPSIGHMEEYIKLKDNATLLRT
jgi:hypothetical protein